MNLSLWFFYFQVEMHYLQCISPKYWTSIFISNSTQSFVNPTVSTLNVFCITFLSWNLSKGLFQVDFRIYNWIAFDRYSKYKSMIIIATNLMLFVLTEHVIHIVNIGCWTDRWVWQKWRGRIRRCQCTCLRRYRGMQPTSWTFSLMAS